MVTDEEREKLSQFLGKRYTTDIMKMLESAGMKSRKNRPYSRGFITNVYLGAYENADIETALWKLYEQRKEKADQLEWTKNRLMAGKIPA